MNRIEEKAHPYADEIPQMEICDTEAVVPGQQKSDSITTHNDSQGSHQCRRNETFVFSDKVKIKIIQPTTAPIKNGAKCLSINTYIRKNLPYHQISPSQIPYKISFHLSSIIYHLSLSLPGESNSRSRTIVAALPSGVSPPDWIPVHARSVTLRV